jgi:hypothetical protein
MKRETLPPWVVVVFTIIIGTIFTAVAWFFLPQPPQVANAGWFSDAWDAITDGVFSNEPDRSQIDQAAEDISEFLPEGTIVGVLIEATNVLLALFSVFLTIAAVWSGLLYFASFGNEENIEKAKRILIYSLVGIAMVAFAYAFIFGITNLDWSR